LCRTRSGEWFRESMRGSDVRSIIRLP
jgi:hypothetical protein